MAVKDCFSLAKAEFEFYVNNSEEKLIKAARGEQRKDRSMNKY